MSVVDPLQEPAAPPAAELDCEAFEELEQLVTRPSFLKALESAAAVCRHQKEAHPLAEDAASEDGSLGSSGTWVHAAGDEAASSTSPATAASRIHPAGQQEDPVLVERQDAVEAMAFYIAQCLTKHPEAQAMSPQQLQDALTRALKGLKQSRFKQICSFGRSAYRWTTLTYSALQMYQNPWLIQAILTAVWTFSRIGVRALW